VLKKRLIPVLLLQNGQLVRSELFKIHQAIGNAVNQALRYNDWSVDELIYLDMSRADTYADRRDDQLIKSPTDPLSLIAALSKTCFMPLTFGGGIRDVDRMRALISAGADKITLNTGAVRTPELITEGAKRFGSQAIVVSIDAKLTPDGRQEVFIDGGREPTGMFVDDWAREVEGRGAGEILLQSIDRDGTATGYDVELIASVASAVKIPVIACSGVGRYEDYAAGIRAGASAVAAANIFHFKDLADRGGKAALLRAGIDVRPVER
jgi:imidazole glycerol-phosphate synthase subunit HisF